MKSLIFSNRSLFLLLVLAMNISVSQAQVPVHGEPLHHLVFENPDLRILDVFIPPGDTTQYHIHHTPSVIIRFTSTTIGSQSQGGEGSANKSTRGTVSFENFTAPNNEIHRVWNADKDTFHVMVLELLFSKTGFNEAPLIHPNLQLEIDSTWTRTYRLTLPKGKSFKLKDTRKTFVLVTLGVAGSTRDESKNQSNPNFLVIKPGQSFTSKNVSDDTYEHILIELPVQ